jgi:hypothetical protein
MNDVQFSQLHAVELVDIDGDGLKDIVTGKRSGPTAPAATRTPTARRSSIWFKLIDGNRRQGRPTSPS